MIASGTQKRVEGLTACCGVVGIAKDVDVELERHRLNLDYLAGKKMKNNKKAPKSQLESRIIQSVKDSLQGKVKCIIAFHTINVSRYHPVVKQNGQKSESFFPPPYLCKVSLPNLLNFRNKVG